MGLNSVSQHCADCTIRCKELQLPAPKLSACVRNNAAVCIWAPSLQADRLFKAGLFPLTVTVNADCQLDGI